MGKIHVFNLHEEDHTNEPGYFYIGRSKDGNPLGNPFTYNGKHSSLAKLSFKTRDEAVDAFQVYFKKCYGEPGHEDLTNAFNKIYEAYKSGIDIYLGCFCKPKRCHGDIIAEELQKKLVREKIVEQWLNKECQV